MYKIKLFRNMAGLSAGKSLRQTLTNKDWWKGVFGNMLSTMLGIALTVGVAALVEQHNNKKLAREMMLQVVRTADFEGRAIESYDSVFRMHQALAAELIGFYMANGRDLTKAPKDSVFLYGQKLFKGSITIWTRTHIDSYFFNAQMMHQFGNADKYTLFASFVKEEQKAMDDIDALVEQWYGLQTYFQEIMWDDPDIENTIQVLQKMIRAHKFSSYYNAISMCKLREKAAWFKYEKKHLLKAAGVTEKEFEDYIDGLTIKEVEGEHFVYDDGTTKAGKPQTDKQKKK